MLQPWLRRLLPGSLLHPGFLLCPTLPQTSVSPLPCGPGLSLCLPFRTMFAPRVDYCSWFWITPLVKLSREHSPSTDSCLFWILFCLALNIPVCHCQNLACFMTTPLNKALQMDLHGSRLVRYTSRVANVHVSLDTRTNMNLYIIVFFLLYYNFTILMFLPYFVK